MTIIARSHDDPAADAAKLLIRLGLAMVLVALPVAGVVSRGAVYALLPVGGISILCGSLIGAPAHGLHRLRDAVLTPLGAAAIFLGLWTALSLMWTPFPLEAGTKVFKMAAPAVLTALVAAYLPDRTRSFDLYLLPIGVAATASLALVLAVFGPPTFGQEIEFDETLLERSVITLIILVWPALAALALREHWMTAAALAVLVAFVALVDLARIALAAMGAGAFTFAVAMSASRRAAQSLAITSLVAILLGPLVPLVLAAAFGVFGEVPAPITVWKAMVVEQWPRLVTGHGFDLASLGRSHGFVSDQAPSSLLFVLWYDLGLLGAFAFAVALALAFGAAGRIPSLLGPAILSALVAALVLAGLGVAVGQIWWLTILCGAAIGFTLVARAAPRIHRPDAIEIEAGKADSYPDPIEDRAASPGKRHEPGRA
jgi:hypothetical protein